MVDGRWSWHRRKLAQSYFFQKIPRNVILSDYPNALHRYTGCTRAGMFATNQVFNHQNLFVSHALCATQMHELNGVAQMYRMIFIVHAVKMATIVYIC